MQLFDAENSKIKKERKRKQEKKFNSQLSLTPATLQNILKN